MYFDLAVDLGSGFVSVLTRKNDIVVKQRNVVALDNSGKVLAFGNEAYALHRNGEGIKLAAPFKDCSILSKDLTEAYFRRVFNHVDERMFLSQKARILAVVNCGINTNEKRDWETVFLSTGAKQIVFVESPKACAKFLANRYSLSDCIVINLGGTAVDFGCLADGKMTNGCSLYLAGQDIDLEIKKFIEVNYNIRISVLAAEEIKRQCSLFENDVSYITVCGVNFESGKEETIELPARSLLDTVKSFADKYCQVVKSLLRSMDFAVADRLKLGGIYLCGGGSGLSGLKEYMSKQLNIRVAVSEGGSNTAVFGARMFLLDGIFK